MARSTAGATAPRTTERTLAIVGVVTLLIVGVVTLLIVASPLLIGGGFVLAGIAFPLAFLVGAGLVTW